MRGHGQIIPIGFGVPVIALENHPKHRGLMDELSLLDYNVKIDDELFLENLQSKIKLLENNRENLVLKYQLINEKLLSESQKAFEIIKTNIIK